MIDEVDIGANQRPDIARIAICQLSLSVEQVTQPGKSLELTQLNALEARLLRTLGETAPYKPQVIVFPECSIPESLLYHLGEWSKNHNCIVISGTHYVETDDCFYSKCPIYFPNGLRFDTEKITISPLEKKPVPGKKVLPGAIRYTFRNTQIGDFIVLICADVLDPSTFGSLDELEVDLVFVVAFQKDHQRYHTLLAEMCVNSTNGIYVCYSNCSCAPAADGKSSLFGIVDKAYLSAFKEAKLTDLKIEQKLWEASSQLDFVIADLDINVKKPQIPKSALTTPNIRIVATRKHQEKTPDANQKSFRLVAFDMDGTLLRGIEFSWTKLWEICGDDGRLWRGHLQNYLRNNLSYDDWCKEAVKYFRAAQLDKDLIFTVARESARLTKNFDVGMSALRDNGFKTALISGGVDIFLAALVPNYKQYFDHVFINNLLFDSDNIVCGVNSTKFDYEGKAKALQIACETYGFDLSESIFVGDRFNDKHAIDAAGHSILYSDSKDGVRYQVDHEILADDFELVANYILSL